jgi:hypothetical protein
MRVASLESVLTAATLVLAIVIVLWGIKMRSRDKGIKGITSAAAEAFLF